MFDTDLSRKILTAVCITGGGLVAFYIVFYFLKTWAERRKRFVPGLLETHLHYPGVILFLVITMNIDLERFRDYFSPVLYDNIRHVLRIGLIIACAAVLVRIFTVVQEILLRRYTYENGDDYAYRGVKTKLVLLQRMVSILIFTGMAAAILMTFNNVRELGNTLLASAGVLGLVLGFAAQKSLGTFFAGIQIAISQPIKLNDIVVVEGTFGTIREINLTYVVINTWDEKRLILPVNYFLEKGFENWTRVTSQIICKAKIYTDYTLPVAAVREEFQRCLESTPLWDKRVANLSVTDATDRTMEVRAIMSARNSGEGFDLECYVRESLIRFVQENHPGALPTARLHIRSHSTEQL